MDETEPEDLSIIVVGMIVPSKPGAETATVDSKYFEMAKDEVIKILSKSKKNLVADDGEPFDRYELCPVQFRPYGHNMAIGEFTFRVMVDPYRIDEKPDSMGQRTIH